MRIDSREKVRVPYYIVAFYFVVAQASEATHNLLFPFLVSK